MYVNTAMKGQFNLKSSLNWPVQHTQFDFIKELNFSGDILCKFYKKQILPNKYSKLAKLCQI